MNKHVSGKSARRQQKAARREMRETNTWSEVTQLAQNIQKGIAMHIGIKEALTVPGIMENLEDPHTVAANLRLLQKDLTKIQEDLNTTYNRHAGKSGTCDPQDIQMLIDILGRYESMSMEYQANVLPVSSAIPDAIAGAERKLLAKQQAAEQATQVKDLAEEGV